jgi:hypothetical protein
VPRQGSRIPATLGEALQARRELGWVRPLGGSRGWVIAAPAKLPNGTLSRSWWRGPGAAWDTAWDSVAPTKATAWWPNREAAEQAARSVYGPTWRRRLELVRVTGELARRMRKVP